MLVDTNDSASPTINKYATQLIIAITKFINGPARDIIASQYPLDLFELKLLGFTCTGGLNSRSHKLLHKNGGNSTEDKNYGNKGEEIDDKFFHRLTPL